MPRSKQGQRVPGRGNEPSAASMHLRKVILSLLTKNPGMCCRSIGRELSKTMCLEKCAVKSTLYMLRASGRIYSQGINSRNANYFVRTTVIPGSVSKQRIKIVPSTELPKLLGPIYQPMDWVVHQLQRQM